MRVKVLLLLVCMYVANLYGQIAGKNQFDFFVGNWEIEQSILSEDGKWLKFEAETIVEKQLTIINENRILWELFISTDRETGENYG